MMEQRNGITRRNLLLGMAGGATVLGGGIGAYRLLWGNGEIYQGPIDSLQTLKTDSPYDVCIIGSGPAGTVLGIDLARQGYRTLILESGPDFSQLGSDPRLQELDHYHVSGDVEYPLHTSRLRALGGTTNIWTGRCSRLHPLDFQTNPYTEHLGGWPIQYSDIQPYYARAEQTLRVRGSTLSEFHAPRTMPLPLHEELDNAELKTYMAELGITTDNSPTSTGLNGSGPVRVARDLLPLYSQYPNASLVSGATATRLLADRQGRVEAVEVSDLAGQRQTIPARHFVVSCGAVESARLLLLSRSEQHPEGLGNQHDQVGRYFTEHPSLIFNGEMNATLKNRLSSRKLMRSFQYYDAFKQQGFGSVRVTLQPRPPMMRMGMTLEMYPQADNRVTLKQSQHDVLSNPAADLFLSFGERDLDTMEAARNLARELYHKLDIGSFEETGMLWGHHHMGTCRMGRDPRHSVTDANMRVHGSDNLYVAGSAVFVSGGASHPTLLITALSHRLAEHLSVRLKEMV